jgi:hypothetical protein
LFDNNQWIENYLILLKNDKSLKRLLRKFSGYFIFENQETKTTIYIEIENGIILNISTKIDKINSNFISFKLIGNSNLWIQIIEKNISLIKIIKKFQFLGNKKEIALFIGALNQSIKLMQNVKFSQ